MEHFHAYGHGLRGYRDGGFRHEAAMHREAGYPHEETMRREGPVNHMEGRGEAMRAGSAHPAMMAGPAGRPGGPAGGFVRPGAMASAGGFHPGAAAPMAHASPAVAHASAGGGGGKKH